MTKAERLDLLRRRHAGLRRALVGVPPNSKGAKGLRVQLEAARAALESLERQTRFARIAPCADMIKALPDRVEVYDARQRRIGVVPPGDADLLRLAIESEGKIPEGRHPAYLGGFTREPGVAVWWREDRA
ncbi:MAG: hypothetical protein ACK4NA_12670 [Alphaproteobacteria bacterium]